MTQSQTPPLTCRPSHSTHDREHDVWRVEIPGCKEGLDDLVAGLHRFLVHGHDLGAVGHAYMQHHGHGSVTSTPRLLTLQTLCAQRDGPLHKILCCCLPHVLLLQQPPALCVPPFPAVLLTPRPFAPARQAGPPIVIFDTTPEIDPAPGSVQCEPSMSVRSKSRCSSLLAR